MAKLMTAPVPEGETALLNASASTEPGDDLTIFLWDLDDDGVWDTETFVPLLEWTWTSPGDYLITLQVQDEDGSIGTITVFQSVTDVAPDANAGGPYEVTEGEMFTLSAINSTEPGDDIVVYRWNLDRDSEIEVEGPEPEILWVWNRSDIVPEVTLEVEDEDGSTDSITFNITVIDLEPTFVPVIPSDVLEGVPATFSLEDLFDPGTETFKVVWTLGDGSEAEGVTVSHVYQDDGAYRGHVTVLDGDGTTVRWDWTEPLPVANVPPRWELETLEVRVTEDERFTFTLLAVDVANDTVEYAFEGPGGKIDPVTGLYSWTPLDEHIGKNTVTFMVTDEDGGQSTIEVVFEVRDVDNDFLGMSVAAGLGLILLIVLVVVVLAVVLVRRARRGPDEAEPTEIGDDERNEDGPESDDDEEIDGSEDQGD
jgi:hypothetical protein